MRMISRMIGAARMDEDRRLDGRAFLVTGGAGFIGSNFIRYMLKTYPHCRIINLDNLTYAGNLENLENIFSGDDRYEFIKGDIRDHKLVGKLIEEIYGVVHFAAETHVDRSILDADNFVQTNVYGSYALFEAIRKSSVKIFLHVSTDEVYGSCEHGRFHENDPLHPSSPYAASKAGADAFALAYIKTYDLPIVILRPSNNFGPYQYPEKFIPLFITNALEGKSLPIYGDGSHVRDWLEVEDHCRAIDIILNRGKTGEVYNVCTGEERQNKEVANMILDILDKPKDLIEHVSDRLGHDRRYAMDCSKIKDLGWKPEKTFTEALESTALWYKNHCDWWRKIRRKSFEFKEFYKTQYGKSED